MRSLLMRVLVASLTLAACAQNGAQRSELPADQYISFARNFVYLEHCKSTGQLSAQDAVELRVKINQNLSRYTYDADALNDMFKQGRSLMPQILADPAKRRIATDTCASYGQDAASNRAIISQLRATELHQAQLAVAQAQVRASNAQALAASHQTPAIYPPPYINSIPVPPVYSPQLGRQTNIYHCRQLGSYVTSCF